MNGAAAAKPRWTSAQCESLRADLTRLTAAGPGRWAFAVREGGESVVSIDGARVVPAASTIKVPILVVALLDVAAGRIALDDVLDVPGVRVGGSGVLRALPSVARLRLAEALELMIVVSDNAATNLVIDAMGPARAYAAVDGLGLTGTRLRRRLMDADAARRGLDNGTTADDQADLLDRLAGSLLPPELRALALGMLERQQVNDRLPARLGPDVVCRHKTGELAGVRHDVGLLEFDGRQIAVAALGTELATDSHLRGGGTAADVISRAAVQVVASARRGRSSGRSDARDAPFVEPQVRPGAVEDQP